MTQIQIMIKVLPLKLIKIGPCTAPGFTGINVITFIKPSCPSFKMGLFIANIIKIIIFIERDKFFVVLEFPWLLWAGLEIWKTLESLKTKKPRTLGFPGCVDLEKLEIIKKWSSKVLLQF